MFDFRMVIRKEEIGQDQIISVERQSLSLRKIQSHFSPLVHGFDKWAAFQEK